MFLEVQLIQSTVLFPKKMSVSYLLGDEYEYGVINNETFHYRKRFEDFFVIYRPNAVGRGVYVTMHEDEKAKIKIGLNPLCTDEDIRDFFKLIERITSYWKCMVSFKKQTITLKNFVKQEETFRNINLKAIHNSMQNILNQQQGSLILRCVKRTLSIGKNEAEKFWAGTNTDAFRDWLNDRQNVEANDAYPTFFDSNSQPTLKVGVYTLEKGKRTIFPNVPRIPMDFYDFKNKKFTFSVEIWSLSAKDTDISLPYQEFVDNLPDAKKAYFDGNSFLCEPLSIEEMRLFFPSLKKS